MTLLHNEEVHNVPIINVLVFKKQIIVQLMYRDIPSDLFHTLCSTYVRMRPFSYAGNSIPFIIFLQGGNFLFYCFIFILAYWDSYNHKLS